MLLFSLSLILVMSLVVMVRIFARPFSGDVYLMHV